MATKYIEKVCPKCEGKGRLSIGMFRQDWQGNAAPDGWRDCDFCEGTGVVYIKQAKEDTNDNS